MGYCTVEDVQAETKTTYTETSVPSINQVEQFIADGCVEINLMLRAIDYNQIPVPAPVGGDPPTDSYAYVAQLNKFYAAARASHKAGTGDFYETFQAEYDRKFDCLSKGRVQLADAAPGTDAPADRDDVSGTVSNFPEKVGVRRGGGLGGLRRGAVLGNMTF